MRRIIGVSVVLLIGTCVLSIPVAGAAKPGTVSPPASIPNNCSSDVSQHLERWLQNRPAGTTVAVPPGACYLINEGIQLVGSQDLTISGGTWEDATTPQPGAEPKLLRAEMWFVGGSNITLENMTITGTNPGGYEQAGAFVAGIRSDGVVGLTVSNVSIDHTYGDGILLAPLRGDADLSGTILNPTRDVTINNVDISGAGRQGITLASVNHALISSVHLDHIGIDVFDIEADQSNEGAANVTINGCSTGSGAGGLFFANGGAGAGFETHDITVENCTMATQLGGDAVLIQTPAEATTSRGPFTFANDTLRCGASVYVACVQVLGGNVSVDQSSVVVPPGTVHEPVYNAFEQSAVTFDGDYVTGYGNAGTTAPNSTVTVAGGVWIPFHVSVSRPFPTKGSTPSPANAASPSQLGTARVTADARSVAVPSPQSAVAADAAAASTGGGGGPRHAAAAPAPDHGDPPLLASFIEPVRGGAVVLLLSLSALMTGVALFRRRAQQHAATVRSRSVVDLLGGSGRSVG